VLSAQCNVTHRPGQGKVASSSARFNPVIACSRLATEPVCQNAGRAKLPAHPRLGRRPSEEIARGQDKATRPGEAEKKAEAIQCLCPAPTPQPSFSTSVLQAAMEGTHPTSAQLCVSFSLSTFFGWRASRPPPACCAAYLPATIIFSSLPLLGSWT
jgi:hypothetical protein